MSQTAQDTTTEVTAALEAAVKTIGTTLELLTTAVTLLRKEDADGLA